MRNDHVCDGSRLFCKEQNDLSGQGMDDTVMNFDAFAFSFDDPLVLEKGEMLGNRCLGKAKAFPDMFYVALLGAKSGNYF